MTTYDDAVTDLILWEPEDGQHHDEVHHLERASTLDANTSLVASCVVECLILLDTETLSPEAWGQEVLELIETVPPTYRAGAFRQLDEGPGAFRNYSSGPAWHWKLRRVRNSPTHGPQLFDLLAGGQLPRPTT